MAICPKCNFEIPDDSIFCTNCGTKLDTIINENVAPCAEVAPESEATAAPAYETTTAPAYEATAAPVENAYSNPTTGVPYTPEEPKKKINIFALIGLILSGVALTFCWTSLFNLMFLLPAIAMVVIGFIKSKNSKKLLSIIGAVVCGVAIIATIVLTIAYYNVGTAIESDNDYSYGDLYDYDDYDYDIDDYDFDIDDYDFDYNYNDYDSYDYDYLSNNCADCGKAIDDDRFYCDKCLGMGTCQDCGKDIDDDRFYCDRCLGMGTCQDCGRAIDDDRFYCDSCLFD